MNAGFRGLLVWQKAMDVAVACYQLTRNFPEDEKYGLTAQIRRAASSVLANIAEGYGRQSDKSFVQYLRIAQGSLRETETHLELSMRVGFLDEQKRTGLEAQSNEIGRMLNALIRTRS